MSFWSALTVFGAYFVIDIVYTLFVRFVTSGRAAPAAFSSTAIYLLMSAGIVHYVDNQLYLIPLGLGAWLGTYVAVKFHLGEPKKEQS